MNWAKREVDERTAAPPSPPVKCNEFAARTYLGIQHVGTEVSVTMVIAVQTLMFAIALQVHNQHALAIQHWCK